MGRNPKQVSPSALRLRGPPASLLKCLLLLERHLRPDLEKAIRRRFPSISQEDLEDLWQEILIRICQSWAQDKLAGHSEIGAWVWTIACHQAIDLLRRRGVRLKAEVVVAVSSETCQEGNPATELMDQEERAAVERRLNEQIAELPPLARRMLQMRSWERKTYRAIGEALVLPTGTVVSRVARILSTLYERLGILPEVLS